MSSNKLKKDIITIEISVFSIEKVLNLLWNRNIKVSNIKRIDITTIKLDIRYDDYDEVKEAVKICKGRVKIVRKSGTEIFVGKLKRNIILSCGIVIFLFGLYYLSTYVWAIEIKTGENVTPYQLRRQLLELGITPGIKKSSFDVYDIEKKIETKNDMVLWSRVRIEGSTLKLVIEEKVNPPKLKEKENPNDCLAKKDGEVKRVYVTSGTSTVLPGDIVKKDDILIKGIEGKEGQEYEVPAKGVVIANTFYSKEMEVQISGEKLDKTGEKDSDIYLKIFGKKIYLKKAINSFKDYDKIEDNSSVLKKVIYFEKDYKTIEVNKEEVIDECSKQLEESLVKNLKNDAKVKDKVIDVQEIGEGKVLIVVNFVVEQDIANEEL